jgi:hypothetical protein
MKMLERTSYRTDIDVRKFALELLDRIIAVLSKSSKSKSTDGACVDGGV